MLPGGLAIAGVPIRLIAATATSTAPALDHELRFPLVTDRVRGGGALVIVVTARHVVGRSSRPQTLWTTVCNDHKPAVLVGVCGR